MHGYNEWHKVIKVCYLFSYGENYSLMNLNFDTKLIANWFCNKGLKG